MESLPTLGLELFIVAWFAYLGASIGSFCNVVADRLPRGQSIVSPGSRCPACQTPIRWYDNVPVLGWLWLRGRCRSCGWRIPARYVWVEVLFASVFVLLYLMNLRAPFDQDLLKCLPRHQPAVWMLFVRNATVMSAVLTIALMRWDGLRVPTRFVAVTVLLVIALVAGTVLVLPRVDGSIPWEELGTRVGGVLLLVVLGWLSWQIIATFIYLIHQGRHPLSDCLLDTAGVVLASLVLSPLSLPIVAVIILIVSLSIPPRWRLVAWVVAMVTLFVIVYPDTILSPVN